MGMAAREAAEGAPTLDELGASDATPVTRSDDAAAGGVQTIDDGDDDLGEVGGDAEGADPGVAGDGAIDAATGRRRRGEAHNLKRGLQLERERSRRLEAQLAEAAARQQAALDRVTQVLQLKQQQEAEERARRAAEEQAAQQRAQAAADPEPDPNVDEVEWLKWKVRQQDAARAAEEQAAQQRVQMQAFEQQQGTIRNILSEVAQFETRYTAMVQPDYMDAFNYVANHRIGFWRSAGLPDEMIFGPDGVLEAEKGWLFRSCMQFDGRGGYSWSDLPPRRLYQLAQHLGYARGGASPEAAGAAAGAAAAGGDPNAAAAAAMQGAGGPVTDAHAANLMAQGVPRRRRGGAADGRIEAMRAGARANVGGGGRPGAGLKSLSYETILEDLDDSDILYLMKNERGALEQLLGKGAQ